MRPCLFPALILLAAASEVPAQEIAITSFQSSGQIEWSAPPGSVCTIEWAPNLGTTDNWSRSWNDARGLFMSAAKGVAHVPMTYRVVCNTNPLSMVTPYVSESDMYWVRQGYSESTNCPWKFIHDGIDFQPKSNLAPFRAVCDGLIMDVCMRHAPPADGGDQHWDTFVELVYDDTWAIGYNFEPISTNVEDGVIQVTNIIVSLLDVVTQGQVIGFLHMPTNKAHVHFSLQKCGYMMHNGTSVCPAAFFKPAASASIIDLITNRFPGATSMCY